MILAQTRCDLVDQVLLGESCIHSIRGLMYIKLSYVKNLDGQRAEQQTDTLSHLAPNRAIRVPHS